MFIVVLGLLTVPSAFVALASTSVVNTLSVTAESGGVRARGGTVTEGTVIRSVDVITTIDGVQIEEVHDVRTEPGTFSYTQTSTSTKGTHTVTKVTTSATPADTDGPPMTPPSAEIPRTSVRAMQVPNTTPTTDTETSLFTNVTEDTSKGTTTSAPPIASSRWEALIASVARVVAYVLTIFS